MSMRTKNLALLMSIAVVWSNAACVVPIYVPAAHSVIRVENFPSESNETIAMGLESAEFEESESGSRLVATGCFPDEHRSHIHWHIVGLLDHPLPDYDRRMEVRFPRDGQDELAQASKDCQFEFTLSRRAFGEEGNLRYQCKSPAPIYVEGDTCRIKLEHLAFKGCEEPSRTIWITGVLQADRGDVSD